MNNWEKIKADYRNIPDDRSDFMVWDSVMNRAYEVQFDGKMFWHSWDGAEVLTPDTFTHWQPLLKGPYEK